MFKFTDFINVTAFFIAFAIGIFITYINYPQKKIIIQWPTPKNAEKITYKDYSNTCYKYKAGEVACPDDKSKIVSTPLQYD